MIATLALRVHHLLEGGWNGWARPVASADEFADFLERWRTNDPNGTWGHLAARGEELIYTDLDGGEPEAFSRIAESPGGEPLYDLSGWMWVELGRAQRAK